MSPDAPARLRLKARPRLTGLETALPNQADWSAPSLDQYYRALNAVADVKPETEEHLYQRLCDLTNLGLRLVCYDLTSHPVSKVPPDPPTRFRRECSGTPGTIARTGPG